MVNARKWVWVLALAGPLLGADGAMAGTHAPWPVDWNNWTDPALWASVGNPGNAGELSGIGAGGNGSNRVCGAVNYTYKISKFEVTAGQYTEFLNAVAVTDTYSLYNIYMDTAYYLYGCNIKQTGSSGSYTYSVPSDWANRPVSLVSWGDAARFVNWLTNGQPKGAQDASTTEDGSYSLNGAMTIPELMAVTRKTAAQGGRYYIPTEDEWYKAAFYDPNIPGGGGYWDYATGTNNTPSNAVVDPVDPGNNANFYHRVHSIGGPYYHTEVGEFENSVSPYGTFDQGGNAYEWIEADSNGELRGARGGSTSNSYSQMAANMRLFFEPTAEYSDWGFRVSEVPEPASMAILAFGWIVMSMRRRGNCR